MQEKIQNIEVRSISQGDKLSQENLAEKEQFNYLKKSLNLPTSAKATCSDVTSEGGMQPITAEDTFSARPDAVVTIFDEFLEQCDWTSGGIMGPSGQ